MEERGWIIGKLNGRSVVAIDTSEKELAETQNGALRIVMDATDLKFLPESFDVCTAFFSLMYIPNDKHPDLFKDLHRVLRSNGRFLLWDAEIPKKSRDYIMFILRLKIRLPNEEVETGYGVKYKPQSLEQFKKLAQAAKFKVISEWSKNEIFHLELLKH